MAARRAVDAVRAEIQELLGLRHAKRPRLGPCIAGHALEQRPVLGGPLAVRVLGQELRAIAGEAVVVDVDPQDDLQPQIMAHSHEDLRWVELLDDLPVGLVPLQPPGYPGVDVAANGRAVVGAFPRVLFVEADGVAQLGPVGQVAQVAAAEDQRLRPVGGQVSDELLRLLLGDGLVADEHLVIEVDVHDELRTGRRPCGQHQQQSGSN